MRPICSSSKFISGHIVDFLHTSLSLERTSYCSERDSSRRMVGFSGLKYKGECLYQHPHAQVINIENRGRCLILYFPWLTCANCYPSFNLLQTSCWMESRRIFRKMVVSHQSALLSARARELRRDQARRKWIFFP